MISFLFLFDLIKTSLLIANVGLLSFLIEAYISS